ncbi:hypothetical protein BC831DRAFT_511366 [Entophlyctis helioformis]|nr:hypothetical protein BC831DRAFT_511366 [Entophlyctis helioformis]
MGLRLRLRRILEVVLNVSSLVIVVGIVGVLLALNTIDLLLWIRADLPALLSVAVSFATLILGSLLLISSRKIASNTAFSDIPKLYMPINSSDVPKPVHEMIQTELSRVAAIRGNAKPQVELLPESVGWGKPGSRFEGVRFKAAAMRSLTNLETELCRISEHLRRDPRMTGRGYMRFLAERKVVAEDVGRFFIDKYETVRFGPSELSETEFREFMQLYTALLRSVKL